MKWLSIATRFPKWAVAILIVVLSSVLFTGWLLFRGASPNVTSRGEPATVANTAPAPVALEFDPDQVILCGNTLLRRDSGEIIAAEWLEGLGAGAPPIAKVIAEEKLVILKGDNGAVGAFGFDGKAKPVLTMDGKPLRSGAFD